MKRLDNRAWVVDDVVYVEVATPTHPCAVALIDADDYDCVLDGQGRWRAERPRGATYPYAARWVGPRPCREHVFLHRHLLGLAKGDGILVDHANRQGLDNRRGNLRRATPAQNVANRLSSGANRFRGVARRPSGTFHAHIRVRGVQLHLGSFADEHAAAQAYDEAARSFYGDFAVTNFEEVAA